MLRKKLNRIFLFLISLACAANGLAQETYDLSSFVNRVLEENYEVRIQRNLENIAKNNNTLGNAGFLPTVDAELTTSKSFNNTNQELSNGTINKGNNAVSNNLNTYAIVNWMVFDGFKMFAKKQQLDLLAQLSTIDTKYFLEQTINDVALAYYQLLANKELIKNFRNTLDISRFRYKLEKKKLEVGASNALSYNQALVDYNIDSLAVLSYESAIKSLEIQLSQYANLDPELPLVFAPDSIYVTSHFILDSIMTEAMEANRDLKRSMLEELIAEKSVKIQQADYYPEVNLYGQYSYSQSTNEVSFLKQNNIYGPQIGLTVRFNLFNGGNDKREVVNEKYYAENATFYRQNKQTLIRASVLDRFNQYQSLKQRLNLAVANAKAALRSLEIASAQFQQGVIDGYDFRQTQLTLILSENRVIQLELELKTLEIELNRLRGRLLEIL
jgi:outer membrane protein TolC